MPDPFSFINTTYPGEAREGRKIALIRSHVASRAQALRRHESRASLNTQLIAGSPAAAPILSPGNNATDGITNQDEVSYAEMYPIPTPTALREVTRNDQAKDEAWFDAEAFSEDVSIPRQGQFLEPSKVNSNHGFARPLEGDERMLLDFYLNHVLCSGYGQSHVEGTALEEDFPVVMRQNWLPFALSQASLLAGIFHVACRVISFKAINMAGVERFNVKKLQYRLACLNEAKIAIAEEILPSDSTIALALLLATESLFEGERQSFAAHGRATVRMVMVRGGLKTLGLDGLLARLIENCSRCDPQTNIVFDSLSDARGEII